MNMSEEQIREELDKVYEGEDWKPLTDYILKLQQENKQLKEQLKQRDEVIDEAIKYINDKARKFKHQETRNIVNIEYNLTLNNHEFIELEEILQKYKGDNNE